jgi:glycosyltransferase involved in cell wall biosynthesis
LSQPSRKCVCIVQPNPSSFSETFLRAHATLLPARVVVIHSLPPEIDGRAASPASLPRRVCRLGWRYLTGQVGEKAVTADYLRLFREAAPDVVMAEYGPTGVWVMDACRRARLPLVVHFHGYDASRHDTLAAHEGSYRALFAQAAGIVAVSTAQRRKLIALGAPEEKVHHNACGADCSLFGGAAPAAAPPVVVAVGRFVEKKGPHLTVLAFREVLGTFLEARLRMIGDGPLLGVCRDLARGLRIDGAVTFLGKQPPEVVAAEMRRARAFVQHSVEASDGDCEGTPVAVLEAGASGLPAVATRHAGIPDVVLDRETGLLVAERDVHGMAAAMGRLLRDGSFAAALGEAGRKRVLTHFSHEHSIASLWRILEGVM